MSNRYGQSITWGPTTAPALFTGEVESYSLADAVTKQNLDGASADWIAMVLHSHKAALDFTSKVTTGSDDFLDLSAGGKIVVSTITGGTTLAYEAEELWKLSQQKRASIRATHYPDITGGTGASAGADLSAATPDQSALGIVHPGATLIYSTYGLGHAAGVLHELGLKQTLRITEDEPSPDGKILGAATHGYERIIRLLLLATGAKPAVDSVLTLTGAPAHAADYRITGSRLDLAMEKGKMYAIDAAWIPPFSA